MGDQFDRAQRTRSRDAAAIDRGKRTSNRLLAGVLAVFALGILVAAVVMLSPLGIVAGLVALASPWAWLRGDRARVDEISAEHRNAYAAELGWSVLAIAALAAGYALFIATMVNGW